MGSALLDNVNELIEYNDEFKETTAPEARHLLEEIRTSELYLRHPEFKYMVEQYFFTSSSDEAERMIFSGGKSRVRKAKKHTHEPAHEFIQSVVTSARRHESTTKLTCINSKN